MRQYKLLKIYILIVVSKYLEGDDEKEFTVKIFNDSTTHSSTTTDFPSTNINITFEGDFDAVTEDHVKLIHFNSFNSQHIV